MGDTASAFAYRCLLPKSPTAAPTAQLIPQHCTLRADKTAGRCSESEAATVKIQAEPHLDRGLAHRQPAIDPATARVRAGNSLALMRRAVTHQTATAHYTI